ncbi:NADP-dependent oxidoreductase domain-containing protein [Infundibulicybe gibba]|nr:NADP-dependent oxidoreductase domain-containing protein [Infundibulicybe gibba]
MPAKKALKLNTGAEMPAVGLGTWRSAPGAVEDAVEHALKFGYTLIDTAAAYGNEKEVGQGIKASGVPRGNIFLTTKLGNESHKDPEEALNRSLKNLGTNYLDLWLMHWPAPMTPEYKADKSINWIDTWKEMERLFKAHPDKLKAIGVSNFSAEFLERLLTVAEVIPAVNQIELHPSCPQEDIIDVCRKNGIVVTAYSPLGSENSPLPSNATVKSIARSMASNPPMCLYLSKLINLGSTCLPNLCQKAELRAIRDH